MSKVPPYSVLIIGCGAIAGGYDMADKEGPKFLTHAKAFTRHKGFHLSACLDCELDKAQSFAKCWDIPQSHDNLAVALEGQFFDVIILCSPTPSHETYLRALQQYEPKLIFCEKPITDNIITAREMAGLYRGRMAVNYLRRFDPSIRQLARDVKAGKYGKFLTGQADYNKGLYNNGSHMADMLQMLLGPVTVQSADNVIADYWPDDPTISAELMTVDGQEVALIGGDVRGGMVFDLSLSFEDAEIRLTDFSKSLTISLRDGSEREIQTDLDRGMLRAVDNIHDYLTGNTPLYSDENNGLAALEICYEIRRRAGQ